MKLGVECLLEDKSLLSQLSGCRVALLGHPASVDHHLHHTLDRLTDCGLPIVAAFGPQHGMRGDKQDDMVESDDYEDPIHGIPVFSLYGSGRRPTTEMLRALDVIVVDLQDVGCRIYTYLTTLQYVLDECSRTGQAVWVLDRPNPVGRPVEGGRLQPSFESFVGVASIPMRHGLTLGEIAKWLVDHFYLNVDLRVVPMQGYSPDRPPGFGWPLGELSWVNPSPNIPSLSSARCFAGTVLVEGTHLSEGRGTTIPLQLIGGPNLDFAKILAEASRLAPQWMEGCILRPCHFEPTFHKHAGQTVSGLQVHVDSTKYDHNRFKPYRLVAILLKAIYRLYPEIDLWRSSPYEYETEKLPIDILDGSSRLRHWVEENQAEPGDLEAEISREEAQWLEESRPYWIYT